MLMRRYSLVALGYLLVAMMLAACGSSDSATSNTQAVSTSTVPASPVSRPDAPAPVDGGFRSDPASVVGATGRPQLLEFFAYW